MLDRARVLFRLLGLRLSSGSEIEAVCYENTNGEGNGKGDAITSLTISGTSVVPNAFWRSPCFASSPLPTFTNTLLICITSSRFVSLEDMSVS